MQALNTQQMLVTLDPTRIDSLKSQIRGKVIAPTDASYDEVRTLWNGMIDRRPAFIVQCIDAEDVLTAVHFANSYNLLISIRGQGHNIAGRALQDNVMLIDLSPMRTCSVDPSKKEAKVLAGATLGDVDHQTQKYGLALPMGINSTTGIAGLTLGGGFGWLSRSLGMTVDSLLSIEAITLDGKRIVCDEQQHSDLFWALRGGGGNFAIVTSFTFKLYPVGPEILCGPVIFDIHDAKNVLTNFTAYCQNCPENATAWAIIRHCPPFPFVPEAFHGKRIVAVIGFYNGPVEAGKRELSKLKQFSTPLGDAISPHAYAAFQRSFDPLLAHGARNYWKSHNFKQITNELTDTVLDFSAKLPSPDSEILIAQMGGAVTRISSDKTAYPHRDISFILNMHTRWKDAHDDKNCIAWARDFYKAISPFATGGSYVNFMSEGDDSIDVAFAQNVKRLAAIKAKYDPNNILRANLNIQPT